MRGQDVIGQALGGEIAFLLGHPLLQPSMRVNDECGHVSILLGGPDLARCLEVARPSRIVRCHGRFSLCMHPLTMSARLQPRSLTARRA
jgi:hypothetical protein